MNGFIPSASARRAAWLLAGLPEELPPAAPGRTSAGESERLELVETIALHMQTLSSTRTVDTAELAVCRRLLEHLSYSPGDETWALRLQ